MKRAVLKQFHSILRLGGYVNQKNTLILQNRPYIFPNLYAVLPGRLYIQKQNICLHLFQMFNQLFPGIKTETVSKMSLEAAYSVKISFSSAQVLFSSSQITACMIFLRFVRHTF